MVVVNSYSTVTHPCQGACARHALLGLREPRIATAGAISRRIAGDRPPVPLPPPPASDSRGDESAISPPLPEPATHASSPPPRAPAAAAAAAAAAASAPTATACTLTDVDSDSATSDGIRRRPNRARRLVCPPRRALALGAAVPHAAAPRAPQTRGAAAHVARPRRPPRPPGLARSILSQSTASRTWGVHVLTTFEATACDVRGWWAGGGCRRRRV